MELHTARGLGLRPAPVRAAAYVERLAVAPAERVRLHRLVEGMDDAAALATIHAALAAQHSPDAREARPERAIDHARGSAPRRLELGYGVPLAARGAGATTPRLHCAPPLNRSTMAPQAWAGNGASNGDAASRRAERRHRSARLRRLVLVALTLGQTYIATSLMSAVLPYHGTQALEVAVLILYAILFFWISAGFWTAACGLLVRLRGGDRHAISRSAAADATLGEGRTAVVMPICNENVARVFAGLRATYDSVAESGQLAHFDFYVLSDSGDPDVRVGEVDAWLAMCRDANAFGRLFYRWRRHRIKRKSGNIADFCRRWGRNYRYLVVLDADSVMTGSCLTRLVQLMEANPSAGIIQTAPCASGRETFYARMQQFATRVYGPLFTAGLHYWQLGESHYWGHNAIIRVAPFTRYCALARLPGRGSLSGEILSHDFVEAALMRRAGWGVWLAYDLDGSYEEMPPNLIDELGRDRRWCHGNLMNARLFLARGLHPAHRAVFVTGVMAYLSSLLWFLFLVLSTALLAIHTLEEPQYFVEPNQLFPLWPEWRPGWAVALFGATATLLFLPKILAVLAQWARGAQDFGGTLRLGCSMVLELVLSALLAPIRMLFHAQFVASALLGLRIQWKSPPREDSETGWIEALRRHGLHTLIGLVWAGFVYWLDPSFLWWLLPVVGAIVLSIPISVFTSRIRSGKGLRRAGLLVIPEEVHPPVELQDTARRFAATPEPPDFVDAVTDPAVNALMCAVGARRAADSPALRERRAERIADAVKAGPGGLSAAQRMALLNDPETLSRLHLEVWASPIALHPDWFAGMARPVRHPFTPEPRTNENAQTAIPAHDRGARRSKCVSPAG